MNDERDDHPGADGLPGGEDANHEEHEPSQPTLKPTDEAEGGDSDTGGESGEGSQSTGSPHGAG